MTTRASLQGVAIRVFALVMLLAAFVAAENSVIAQCPQPETTENALGECVLISDRTLTRTLPLPSNTTLNCQQHTLSRQTLGRGTAIADRSNPEVAIFLNGVQNVLIKNCTFKEFDFAIFAINSKRNPDSAPPIRLLNNTIVSRFAGISLISVDDAEIRDNKVTSITKGGRAIYVGRNSDRNRILNNEIRVDIRSTNAVVNEAVRVPGTAVGVTNPRSAEGSAVLITQTEGPEPALLNAIIDGVLYQLPVRNTAAPEDFSEDNIFEGNSVIVTSVDTIIDGVVVAAAQGSRVSRNRVVGAKNGIRVGQQTTPKQFPGTCANLNLTPEPHLHFCFQNDDECNLSSGDLRPCERFLPQNLFWVSHKTIIQDNEVLAGQSGFVIGIATTGVDTVITGNEIKGPGTSGGAIGIRMVGKFALGTTTVTRNSVRDVAVALDLIHEVLGQPVLTALDRPGRPAFTATVSMNDFISFTDAVKLNSSPGVSAYNLLTELSGFTENSAVRRGNFWKRGPCPDDAGFLPAEVEPPNSRVTDSHPFGQEVINRPLLAPCS